MIDKNNLREMIIAGNNRADIASFYKISIRTLSRRIADYNISYAELTNLSRPTMLSDIQNKIITGSLLGDGSLVHHGRSKNSRYRIKQQVNKIEYVKYMNDIFCDFLVGTESIKIEKQKKPIMVDGKITYSSEEFCEAAYFWTCAHPVFTELRNKWYVNGVKIIPNDLYLTPESIAHWFLEDGTNSKAGKYKSVVLCTNCFSLEEVHFLKFLLKENYDIGSYVNRVFGKNVRSEQYVIRVSASSYFDFINLVRPYIEHLKCFNYKIDTSKAPKNRKGTPWTGAKLTKEQVQNIRKLRPTHKLKELAEQFDVSISTIGKIANFQMYKPDSLEIAGKADVKLGVRYAH